MLSLQLPARNSAVDFRDNGWERDLRMMRDVNNDEELWVVEMILLFLWSILNHVFLLSYLFEEFVGKGQFGQTYKVRYQSDDTIWLAKSIDLSSLNEKDKFLSLQEAAVMQQLHHSSIVQWRETFIHDGMFLIIIMVIW